MMRSESTSALGQPRDTSPTRGADLGADLGAGLGARRLLVAVEDLLAPVPGVLCMCGLLACARGTRKWRHSTPMRQACVGRSASANPFRAHRVQLIPR